MNEKKFFLIDGNALAYQAYYAFQRQELTNPAGEPVGAFYGFLRKLFSLIETHQPDYLYVVFDSKGKTDNHELFEEYKANRKPMPGELRSQIQNIKSFLDTARIARMEIPGHEADDIIGSLAEKIKKDPCCRVTVYTPDKDLLQLIDDRVLVLKSGPKEDKPYDRKRFEEEFGFPLQYFTDYLALMGDSSDNIPGVKGIGPKGAKNLIAALGDVETIIKQSEKIGNPRAREQIKEQEQLLLLSKKLVVINRHISFEIEDEKSRFPQYDPETIRSFFQEQGFRSLLRYIKEKPGKSDEKKTAPVLYSDEDPSEKGGEFLLFQKDGAVELAAVDDEKYYRLSSPDPLLKRPEITLWVWDAHEFIRKSDPAASLLDIRLIDYWANHSETFSSSADFYRQRSIDSVKELRDYFLSSRRELKTRKVWDYIIATEMALPNVLSFMEERGVKIDIPRLESHEKELVKEIGNKEKEIFAECGEEFNLRSPRQLGEVLFEKMGIKTPGRMKKTKTGYSTDESVLQKVAAVHPVGEMLLEYRKMHKILSTYILPIKEAVDENKRLHTTFDYCGTATGRLSSKDPNVQNIPIYGEWGKKMRQLFIADSGYCLVSADYSQMELRIMAHYSGDENLISIFREKGDIHSETARRLFGETGRQMRHKAKAVNFGIIYGQSAYTLSSQLGISLNEAESLIQRYFERFAGVRSFIDKTVNEARENGWVSLISGRRRKVAGIDSKNRMMREAAQRIAVNTPIQGSAADIIKEVMARTGRKWSDDENVRLLLQIHDELLFEVKEDVLQQILPEIQQIMEKSPFELSVPLSVEISHGKNWEEAH